MIQNQYLVHNHVQGSDQKYKETTLHNDYIL